MIEYGPELLGDKTYVCPKRVVALSQSLRQLWVNTVVFTSYHLFHATTRILPGVKTAGAEISCQTGVVVRK